MAMRSRAAAVRPRFAGWLMLGAALAGATGCGIETASQDATPPDVLAAVEPTAEPDPTAVPEATATPADATPAPTATVEAPLTSEPTQAPDPTARPAPTATPVPTATPAPTSTPQPTATPAPEPEWIECEFVQGESGPIGTTTASIEVVADGLEVPWGMAFLPDGEVLFTERPGRLRLIADDQLVDEPVLEVEIAEIDVAFGSEGGLLGVLLHPDFADNQLFYLYITATTEPGLIVNRLLQYRLSDDLRSAELDSVILDDIPAGGHHQGGRMAIGPDGKLYVGVGAYQPAQAQDSETIAGKLLRLNLDGSIPNDNPTPDSAIFLSGIRNSQGFDWFDDKHLVLVDHGPSAQVGSSGLRGLDEFNVAVAGDNLGWADLWGCDTAPGLTTPVVVWDDAIAPGGAALYRGEAFPRWTGSVLVGTLGLGGRGQHLHRLKLDPVDPYRVTEREMLLVGEYGRMRTVAVGPDGLIYVTTSNCDGRGTCPPEGDVVLRISPG